MDHNKMKVVYVITQRNNRSFWNRVGLAFVNGDGSINVKLDAVPVSGELQIRDYVPRDSATGVSSRLADSSGNGHLDSHSSYAEMA
jgi:hypothetical protein